MLRDFGTKIHQLVHEPNDQSLSRLITKQIRESLMQFEPRIVIVDVRLHQHDGEMILELHYIHSDRPQADVLSIPIG
jgi:phage baseplate assembly protein W